MKALFTLHKVDGKRIRLTTNTLSDPRELLLIEGTPYRLAVPLTLLRLQPVGYTSFTLGPVRFNLSCPLSRGYRLRALDPIPPSWCIDLSADIPASEEEQGEYA